MRDIPTISGQAILALCCLTVLGCENPAQTSEVRPATPISPQPTIATPDTGGAKAPLLADTTVVDSPRPLNCPRTLVAHSNYSARESQQYLSFSVQENIDFRPKDGDACQGDIKNLWPDLLRFDAQIERHMPNIYGIHDVDRALKYFPVTEREFKVFIDDAANKAGLYDRLDLIDRSTLEGGMEVDHTILRLLMENEEAYFAREHTPIIESVLSKYDLKMQPYQTEKMGYCYHPYEICRAPNQDEPKPGQTDFKLERLSPGFSWYQFEMPD